MKKIFFTCILLSVCFSSLAQTWKNYNWKAEFSSGTIFKYTKHLKNLVSKPVIGGEFAVEFQTTGDKKWHEYYNFPVIGIGINYMNLGNLELLGHSFALYPYLNIPIIEKRKYTFNIKLGTGISYITKTFNDTYKPGMLLDDANAAIGSHLNAFISGGINTDFDIGSGFRLTADVNWNHMSNGTIIQPNSGLSLINGFVGIKYKPDIEINYMAQIQSRILKKFEYDITLSGGVRELYYKDDKRYPIASLNAGAYYRFGHGYRMGLGGDIFYDGVYNGKTLFERTYILKDEWNNKFRAGISWRHEMIIGRLTAGIHLGLYLYNPIKNLEPYHEAQEKTLKKPLIYMYNIEEEDGWFYTRFLMKYTLYKDLFVSVGLKKHLQKTEFIEWGIGLRF
jgi:hypothetical protein